MQSGFALAGVGLLAFSGLVFLLIMNLQPSWGWLLTVYLIVFLSTFGTLHSLAVLNRNPRHQSSSLSTAAALTPTVVGFASLFALSFFVDVAEAAQWNAALCARPVGVGSSTTGTPFTLLAQQGATVSKVRFYRNNGQVGYLRGLIVFFTDGLELRAGVRKDQFSELVFGEDELVTGTTLWKVGNAQNGTLRVARIDVATGSQVWGYGVDDTSQLSATAVNVGSGVLVGFTGRSGDDIDQLAPVFLKKWSSSSVDNIVFEAFDPQAGLSLVTLREGSAVWNGTDYTWTFSGSETRETTTTFTSGSSNSLNMGTTFRAAVPFLESGISGGWTGGSTTSQESRSNSNENLAWSVSVSLSSANPSVTCTAMVWQGILNVGWTGIQTVVVDGRVSWFPVSGVMSRVAYGKVQAVCGPLPSSPSPGPLGGTWDGWVA